MNHPSQAHLEAARKLHAQGNFREADAHYAAAERLAPGDPAVAAAIAIFCMDTGRFEEAAFRFEQVRTARPDLVVGHLGAGDALYALGRPQDALAGYAEASRLDPNNPAIHFGQGNALQALGRLVEARTSFERAIALAPDVPAFHRGLAMVERFRPGDPRLTGLERLAANEMHLPEPLTVDLNFALGKAFDDLGRYDEAFARFAKANAVRRRYSDYDESSEMAAFKAIAGAFPASLFSPAKGGGDPSKLPLFIVGMPRCGSSLVEQILASHPAVHGGGEMTFLPQLIDSGHAGRDFPFDIARLDGEALRRLGTFYVGAVRRLAPSAERIVDKALSNFRFIGLIRLALPNARILHVRRDSRDTCLSCFFQLFAEGVDFACDLSELGRYYRAYEALMAHWRAVLPPDSMLEVDYEALVEDPEGQTRRILDYCGLGWDPRCLEFHRTERVVHTVSAAQVREPIYRRAVARWKHYEAHLGPLFAALSGG